MARILFLEDDKLIASGLIYTLTQEGYEVVHCEHVSDALHHISNTPFSLGLLDLTLPDGTGFTVCRALKEKDIPVIILTAVDDEGNTVQGLEMGADDYITKPFRLRELLARMKNALRRRGQSESAADISINPDIQIYTRKAAVYRGEKEIELTALEYRLLLTLATHRGQVLTRTQLLEGIWDIAGNFVNDNTLTVYIKRLREKLGDDGQQPAIIQTIRGMGYKLNG